MLQNSNQIGDDGAVGLGEGLKVSSSLQILYLVRRLFLSLFYLLRGRCREKEGRECNVDVMFLTYLQSSQSCGAFNALGSCSLLRFCKNLIFISFDCFNWSRCVASDSWGDLPVPAPEVISQGTESVFQFVKAVLQGGSFTSRSCRVMVVGPQMVRSRARIGRVR